MKTKSQKEKLLEVLKSAGDKGVSSFWGYQNYMPRMGARIWDLKAEGYNIVARRNKKDSGCTYFLIEENEQ